ncbi:lachesin isoform X1 [Anopheles gambiae]|uniref:lachesin isoform X1 n=1 Tax=Anopheles gambiae TaxID=7165 RepID=UPI002AC94764|nr:lachesin isoform X1 [Anopheles gambiae]XP_061497056.1 lachesin isoform X1 [Anopheles gambiae]XP_061497067.1 lachesin isoform X1 [Anopheles gambiae]XP_061497078.1 lachesin isoform X1 [Anopheles gambiae]XP_061497086.1 lachesin isoform X1 [Anopheles gambiae]XP_061497094.1 lachesin isoform X1 [Anopheles gambiae]XP_061497102.1 lachesin isoform X1 [Anopheles gambiae]
MPFNQLITAAMVVAVLSNIKVAYAFQPDFAESIINNSIAIGRDATFTCHVRHLGGYRVGWLKADTKAIQAIHEHVITHNPRVTVSHADQNTWNLHIKSVTEEDRGGYMCQLNTDPMKSQIGYLDVVIPPDFISEDTSSDVIVPEGSSVKLTCRAKGYPEPIVTWRREDGTDIILKDAAGSKQIVPSYRGEVLKLSKISRSEMGSYLCIASNGVPPSVSKRISLSIHFHPVIQVPNQLVGAPLGTDVTIECQIEASPKSINYWVKDTGEMLVSSPKYQVQDVTRSLYEAKMSLTVRSFQKEDVGSYRCIAKNSLGEVDSSIRLYEIPGRNRKMYTTKFSNNEVTKDSYKQGKLKVSFPPDDEEQQYGSTEDLNDVSDSSINSNKQSNVQGKVGTIKFVTPRSPIDHSNSVNGVGTSGGYMGVNVHLNKQFPSIDIVTRNPFVIPTIRTGVDGPDGINGHSYGHSTASKKSLSFITSFSIIFFLLVSLQITIQTD